MENPIDYRFNGRFSTHHEMSRKWCQSKGDTFHRWDQNFKVQIASVQGISRMTSPIGNLHFPRLVSPELWQEKSCPPRFPIILESSFKWDHFRPIPWKLNWPHCASQSRLYWSFVFISFSDHVDEFHFIRLTLAINARLAELEFMVTTPIFTIFSGNVLYDDRSFGEKKFFSETIFEGVTRRQSSGNSGWRLADRQYLYYVKKKHLKNNFSNQLNPSMVG